MLQQGTMSIYDLVQRPMNRPAGASDYAKSVFRAVLKLPTIRHPELKILKDNYEGDHEKMIAMNVRKPPSWDDDTWQYFQKDLMHVNSTRASIRKLMTGVYGGPAIRRLGDKVGGPFLKQMQDLIASPEWVDAMKRLNRETIHYGTGFLVPEYDKETRQFTRRHLNPVTTHILVNEDEPEIPVVVAEFDQLRRWVRIWTTEFYAVLARSKDLVEYSDYIRDPQPTGAAMQVEADVPLDSAEEVQTVNKPFFPVLITKTEDVPGSPYGISSVRDTPKFNEALTTSYFNVSFASKLKAQCLLAISTESSDEVNADLTQLGPFTALVLDKKAAAEFLASNADVDALFNVITSLQDLEEYLIGLPDVPVERNLSAAGANQAAAPRASQISELAIRMSNAEVGAMNLTCMDAHFVVGSPATLEDVKRMYGASVRLKPRESVEPLQTRQQSLTQLAKDSVIPAVELVAEFNSDYMSYPEMQQQALEFQDKAKAAVAPKPPPAAPPPPDSKSAAA
jgi:hypothetical protein